MSMTGFFLAFLAGADPAPGPAAAEPPPFEDIVVTGVRGHEPRRPRPDAVEILRAHCFDAARRSRRFDTPSTGSRWIELDPEERRQFKILDSAVPAYSMEDEARGQHLWLKFERVKHPRNTEESKCTLLVVGGRDHERFVRDMSSLLGGPPTQRHVGERDGSPAIAGWEQWLWTGMPPSGSKSWESTKPRKGSPPSWIVVVDARGFYNSYDYIYGEMKMRVSPGPALTVLTFSFTTRPGRESISRSRRTRAGAADPLRAGVPIPPRPGSCSIGGRAASSRRRPGSMNTDASNRVEAWSPLSPPLVSMDPGLRRDDVQGAIIPYLSRT